MKHNDMLESLEYLDPELIAEADAYRPAGKAAWIRWGAMAACLCLCIFGAAKVWPHLHDSQRNALTEPPAAAEQDESPAVTELSETGPAVEPQGAETENEPLEIEVKPEPAEIEINPAEHSALRKESAIISSNTSAIISRPDVDVMQPKTELCVRIESRYDSSLNDAADLAVHNGCCELSNSLKAGIGAYGDATLYQVVVEVFRDGVSLYSGSAEVKAEEERLVQAGYTVAHETISAGTDVCEYFTLHATEEQLLRFPVSESYGYLLSFYDEYPGLGNQAIGEPVWNDSETPVWRVAPVEGSSIIIPQREYPPELIELQEAISTAMADGDLPYVYVSAIMEDPLRIEVRMDTSDEALVEAFRSAYDPTDEYIEIVSDVSPVQE